MELYNVLYLDTYTDTGITPRERYDFVEGRRLCRSMLRFLHSKLLLVTSWDDDPLSIQTVQWAYLRGQIIGLLTYQGLIDDETIDGTQQDGLTLTTPQVGQPFSRNMLYTEIHDTVTYGKEALQAIAELLASTSSEAPGPLHGSQAFLAECQRQATFGWPISSDCSIKWKKPKRAMITGMLQSYCLSYILLILVSPVSPNFPNIYGKTPDDEEYEHRMGVDLGSMVNSDKRTHADDADVLQDKPRKRHKH